jgi:hypothetical protein
MAKAAVYVLQKYRDRIFKVIFNIPKKRHYEGKYKKAPFFKNFHIDYSPYITLSRKRDNKHVAIDTRK